MIGSQTHIFSLPLLFSHISPAFDFCKFLLVCFALLSVPEDAFELSYLPCLILCLPFQIDWLSRAFSIRTLPGCSLISFPFYFAHCKLIFL